MGLSDISRYIWETRYRAHDAGNAEACIEATWWRVARALAAGETRDCARWAKRFHDLLADFAFLPGGRILAGAGTGREVTLFNCFVMNTISDSESGIAEGLNEGVLTMEQGGGVGLDFSTLTPVGSRVRVSGADSAGPVAVMRLWDSTCATVLTGGRRGAMMGTLRCDHPDVETFVDAKRDPRELRNFNVSVLITDEFMDALESDADWPLVFPAETLAVPGAGQVTRPWSGRPEPVPCRVLRSVKARDLWSRIVRASYDCAEPGVLFIDRINRNNNLRYREWISATNPCGEVPLPPYGACDLGSLNLPRFVRAPFTAQAALDLKALERAIAPAVRMLDNVIDVSHFPLRSQRCVARATRRIGLGVTGLADALAMLGLRYDSEPARALAANAMRRICHAAYRASIELAREKGSFPALDRPCYLQAPFVRAMPEDIRDRIAAHGIRNSHLVAIAPAGTISLLAGNISSGIEPVYSFRHRRRVRGADGLGRDFDLENQAYAAWREAHPTSPLPAAFVTAADIPPRAHLAMAAAVSPFVDNAMSKTVNVPADIDYGKFESLYRQAWASGLKGCTTFRPNPVTGAVLDSDEAFEAAVHCGGHQGERD